PVSHTILLILSLPSFPPLRHPLSSPTRRSSDLATRYCSRRALLSRGARWRPAARRPSTPWPTTYPAPRTTTATSKRESVGPVAKDRKSTRLNSSHVSISYAVFCL